ncbi:MAG: lysophospholipid acyltransferase family protein [Paludibacteraceae bacterium]|nr:lysophospholipid acyltransferase family protein [Paludibacteraceae bacterium]MEE1254539.1 lysophospholipid acyltransferase family protein [Paludibacteraceae bacterium]
MKSVLYFLYGLYQYIIVWPIMVVLTLFTAVFTMIFVPFRNAEFVHKVQQFWSRSFYRLMFLPVTVEGLEHIQPGQSYVFVSNHQSMFDVWLIYGWLPVIFKWLMKAELRKVPFVGIACKAAGHIFVDRKNPKAAMESMENIKKQLKDGVCTVIFPEGTRTKDGQVGRFKRGAFQIALDLKLPIIPISLSGCYDVLPKGKPFVYRRPVRMYVGEPIDITQFENNNDAIDFVRGKVIENMCR